MHFEFAVRRQKSDVAASRLMALCIAIEYFSISPNRVVEWAVRPEMQGFSCLPRRSRLLRFIPWAGNLAP
jgi:hypothetical protein